MPDVYHRLSIGLRFEMSELFHKMNKDNCKTYCFILRNIKIYDPNSDEINRIYKYAVEKGIFSCYAVYDDEHFEEIKEEILEELSNIETSCFDGNLFDENFVFYGIFELDKTYQIFEKQYMADADQRGVNIQSINIDKINNAINKEIIIYDNNKNIIDLSILPPYKKVVSLFTETF